MNIHDASIYVGTYKKYNDGDLTGKWFKLSDYSSKEDFLEDCNDFHDDEDDPELMFQDYEDIPESMVGESFVSERIWEIIDEVPEHETEAYFAFVDHFGIDSYQSFQDAFHGEWDNEKEFAQHIFDELYAYNIPDHLEFYFDMELFARDLFTGDYVYVDGFVFACNF